MRTIIALILALVPSLAFGQGAIRQNGPSTKYDMLGFIQDHQAEAVSKLFTDNARGANPIHIFNSGGDGVCTEDALTTGAYHQICLGHDTSGNAVIDINSFNGAAVGSPRLNFNGTSYPLIGLGGGNMTGPNSSVTNELALFNNTNGTATKGTSGDVQYSVASGLTLGYPNPLPVPGKLTAQLIYSGTDVTPYGGFIHLDDKSSNGSSNPDGAYCDIWYHAPTSFTGLGAGCRSNVYTVPPLTATIGSAGTGYTNNDTVTLAGGTCTNELNVPPRFTLTVSGGIVTAATQTVGDAGACGVYPPNPASVTGGTGSGLTLNITNPAVNVTYLASLYGRSRHTAAGTVTNSVAVFADGSYNAGGGTMTNTVGLWLQPPYDTNWTNSYGIYVPTNIGSFSGGIIATAVGVDINLNPGGGGSNVTSTGGVVAGVGQPCRPTITGGSGGTISASGTSCFLILNAQTGGVVETTVNGQVASTFNAPPSATNYIQFGSNTTGNPPTMTAAGGDANVDLQISPLGSGLLKLGNPSSFSANGAVATALSSIGPTGSHTTVQEWLTVRNSAGVIRYIPAF